MLKIYVLFNISGIIFKRIEKSVKIDKKFEDISVLDKLG